MLDGQERHALITGIDDEFAVLQRGETLRRVAIASLDERWSGDVLMFWRLPPSAARESSVQARPARRCSGSESGWRLCRMPR